MVRGVGFEPTFARELVKKGIVEIREGHYKSLEYCYQYFQRVFVPIIRANNPTMFLIILPSRR